MKTIANPLVRALTVLLIGGGVAACGGGGGGDDNSSGGGGSGPPTGGIDGVGRARGAITGFGSIIVNGVRFNTTSASFTVDDNPGAESDLDVGDVVEVVGRIANDGLTGTAEQVFANDAVEGPVDSIDLAGSRLVVMSTLVIVSRETVFDDSFSQPSLAAVTVGQVVEVSGFFNADGAVLATRIEPKPAGGVYEVEGVVSSLNTGESTFRLGDLLVDYSAAVVRDGTLQNGACVEAKGSQYAGGVLEASTVEVESCNSPGANGDKGEIEGPITEFNSASDFKVSGQPVSTSSSTVYEGGTSASLGLNVRVEVSGTYNASGVLVASEVEFEEESEAGVSGQVDAITSTATPRTFRVLGVTVSVDAGTTYEDSSATDSRTFGFDELRTGDYVEVRGIETGSLTLQATLVKRDDLEDEQREVRGTASEVGQTSLRVLGVSVLVDSGTEYRDANDLPLTAQQFLGQAEGRLIEAYGTWDGTRLLAASLEFED